MPFLCWLFSLSPLVLGMLGVCAVPTNRAICIYTHRAAVPRPASGYPLCSKGTLGVSTEIEDSGTDRSLGVSAVQRKVTLQLLVKWCPD